MRQQRKTIRIISIAGVLGLMVLFVLPASFAGAQRPTPPPETEIKYQYFSKTGHNVRGSFLDFFWNNGDLEVFGYPITEQFYDPGLGRTVQYFQNFRLELWPENPQPYKVQPGLLNVQLGRTQQNPSPATTPDCYFFNQTGHSICYAFLDYFRQYGGIDVFGYPIDEFRVINARIVQYFQRATLEWHPERPVGQRVQPGRLGIEWFEFAGYDIRFKDPALPFRPTDKINLTELRVQASVSEPVIRRGNDQTVFLVVRNQLNYPVAGATATMVVHFSSGPVSFTLPPTNAQGLTQRSFAVIDSQPGQTVWIEIAVSYGNLTATEQISILPWW